MENRSDICLVVEGSYPYVTGGVASWLQWLMENLPEFTFSVVALIAEKKREEDRKYPFPPNLVAYEEYVLFDYSEIEDSVPLTLSRQRWRELQERLYRLMKEWRRGVLSEESIGILREVVLQAPTGIFRNFLEDEGAFALLTRLNGEFREDAGFVKYFYNFRNIHLIFFRVLTLIPRLPSSALYHAPGTGFAGFIACLRKALYGTPSIITEHGIYLQEREMELLKSDWLDDPYLKDMWIEAFTALCHWQYGFSDRIITLYEGNKRLEMEYGAREGRIQVIPNGIDVERFVSARSPRCRSLPRTVGFVGRVDSVKDIKTFIQAMAMVRKEFPEMQALVIGPTSDQPGYFQECRDLIRMLDLEETVTFTGRADVLDYYRKMDVLVLTSIKEAMPLVVMEAMASGVPVVATDVGACRELLYGREDDEMGEAGLVRGVMDAEGIAEATVRILGDPRLADRLAESGIRRIEAFYREERIAEEYREIYRELLRHAGHHFSA
ncbi:MAG: GT4 family glycosyltransferase PelF [Deltaproteobacteria bacterium]|nr:GT4 family glycosyltransferase PelF [Deltaproteobacteria bacterium]MBW2015859.1 GT4 family glycosyltransferase PelF [Deltaproteobacteria bacterium]MBW2128982.1 GT4 family glycosyltransferase PelF [Deltaproteobacteria bacterium]MBW2302923.1 GT4 family glycosyltransferase PelF [Deltaproteobacteria bacterium]